MRLARAAAAPPRPVSRSRPPAQPRGVPARPGRAGGAEASPPYAGSAPRSPHTQRGRQGPFAPGALPVPPRGQRRGSSPGRREGPRLSRAVTWPAGSPAVPGCAPRCCCGASEHPSGSRRGGAREMPGGTGARLPGQERDEHAVTSPPQPPSACVSPGSLSPTQAGRP